MEGDNYLAGIDVVERANDYLPKLRQLGCDLHFLEAGEQDDLALGRRFQMRRMTCRANGSIAVEFAGRDPIVFHRDVRPDEVLYSAFTHPDLCGVEGLARFLPDSAPESWRSLEIIRLSPGAIEAHFYREDGIPTRMALNRNPGTNAPSASLAEYLEIPLGGRGYFAGRCLSPVPFKEWRTRIAEITSSPEPARIPLTVTIGITDQCNLDCEYCFSRGRKRTASMPGDALIRLIDQMADAEVRALRFVGAGESTIHPDFVAALLLARARGLGTFLITNGSRLHSMPGILAGCLDSIRVSIQCAAPWLDMVLHGIRQLNTERGKNASGKQPLLGASCVITAPDLTDIPAVARELKSAGADYLLLKKAHGTVLSPQAKSTLDQEIRNLISLLQDDSFRILPELFDYEAPDLAADYYQGPAGCLLHHLRVVIEPDGDVLTCHQKGNAWFARIGNIHRSSFLAIMHGEERKRAMAVRRQKGSVCPDCLFKDAHLLISGILEEKPE